MAVKDRYLIVAYITELDISYIIWYNFSLSLDKKWFYSNWTIIQIDFSHDNYHVQIISFIWAKNLKCLFGVPNFQLQRIFGSSICI